MAQALAQGKGLGVLKGVRGERLELQEGSGEGERLRGAGEGGRARLECHRQDGLSSQE